MRSVFWLAVWCVYACWFYYRWWLRRDISAYKYKPSSKRSPLIVLKVALLQDSLCSSGEVSLTLGTFRGNKPALKQVETCSVIFFSFSHQWDKTHPSHSALPKATRHERCPLINSGSQNGWFCRAQKGIRRPGLYFPVRRGHTSQGQGVRVGVGEWLLKRRRTLHWGEGVREELGKSFLNYVPLNIGCPFWDLGVLRYCHPQSLGWPHKD